MSVNEEQSSEINIMRDFYSSTVMQKLKSCYMGLLSEVEKTDLKRRVELLRLTVEDEETFTQIISDTSPGNTTLQNIVYEYHKENGLTNTSDKNKDAALFRLLISKVAEPTEADLVKNRFIKLLDEKYNELGEDGLKKAFISMARMYVEASDKDVADKETLLDIYSNILWSMDNRYHISEDYQRSFSYLLKAIQAQAIQEHKDSDGEIVIPNPFYSKRLTNLRVN